MTNSIDADVLIVGAGPAGCAAATYLARAGWRVLLVDRASFPRDKTCGDGLTPRAIAALEALGALERIVSLAHRITGARLFSPSGHQLHVRFAEHLDGLLPPFGLVVPRFRLDDALRMHAVAQGARFLGRYKATGPLPSPGEAGVVGLHKGRRRDLRARLVILATGASLPLLRAYGFLDRMPPTVSAARGYWEGVQGAEDAFEFYFDRRLRRGYAWLFPLGQGRANIGIGLFPSREERIGSAARLLPDFLEDHPVLRERLRRARLASPIKGYPLRTDFPHHPVVKPGVMLVGEACGLVNPVTGEGIDLALESGLLAARVADEALRAEEIPHRSLARYQRALNDAFAGFFREMRFLLRVATGPRALDILIRKAACRPRLARTIIRINLGMTLPRAALSPRTWRDILF